jgi:hypothetical protein
MFLGDLGLPPIDHVQSGNVFIVDDVCRLGGYENTLLGYKTRIYRLCKDHLEHLDVILFGKLSLFCKKINSLDPTKVLWSTWSCIVFPL